MKILTDSIEVEVTPELVAKAFWEMGTVEQARFFSALAKETKNTDGAYGYGEMQWCMLQDDLKKDKEAMRQYMALSAFAFDFWPQKYN